MATTRNRIEALEALEQANNPSMKGWPCIVDDSTSDSALEEIQRTTGRPVWRESDPAWAEIFLG